MINKHGTRRGTPMEKLSRFIIPGNTRAHTPVCLLCTEPSEEHLGAEARCAQTMTECAKVRQATVFLVQLGPMETE